MILSGYTRPPWRPCFNNKNRTLSVGPQLLWSSWSLEEIICLLSKSQMRSCTNQSLIKSIWLHLALSAWGQMDGQLGSQGWIYQMWGLWPICKPVSFSPVFSTITNCCRLPSQDLRRTWETLLSLQGKILLLSFLCRCNSTFSMQSDDEHSHEQLQWRCLWGQRWEATDICLAWWVMLYRIQHAAPKAVALPVRGKCRIPLSRHSHAWRWKVMGFSQSSHQGDTISQANLFAVTSAASDFKYSSTQSLFYILIRYQLQPHQLPHFSSCWAPDCPGVTTCWCGSIEAGSHLLCLMDLQTGLVREACLCSNTEGRTAVPRLSDSLVPVYVPTQTTC